MKRITLTKAERVLLLDLIKLTVESLKSEQALEKVLLEDIGVKVGD